MRSLVVEPANDTVGTLLYIVEHICRLGSDPYHQNLTSRIADAHG